MPIIQFLPSNNVINIRDLIAGTESKNTDNTEAIILKFPEGCFLDTSAIALLTSWLMSQKIAGHRVEIEGNSSAVSYLARMNFHSSLGLIEPTLHRNPEAGRFIPIILVQDGNDVFDAVNKIADIILQQFDNAKEFLPAFEWTINEIIDNVFIHSQSKSPGVVCAQHFPKLNRLDIVICDSGIGIKSSLGGSFDLKNDEDAITKALEKGVTRNLDIGQGLGMAGTLEIMKQNRGAFSVWSGSTLYRLGRDKKTDFLSGPSIPGTGVLMSFNLEEPVLLEKTWIGESGWSYIDAEAERVAEQGIVVKDVCSHTGSRPPATRLRRKILALLPEVEGLIKIDFQGVTSLSSSFLDEFLGRLNAKLGNDQFNEKFIVTGLSELHKNMANNVIAQRLATETKEAFSANCWVALEMDPKKCEFQFPEYALEIIGDLAFFSGIREADWMLMANSDGKITSVGKVLRKRSTVEKTTIYFEIFHKATLDINISEVGSSPPVPGQITRFQWSDFVKCVPKITNKKLNELLHIENQAYIRELLQLAVVDDLLGPAEGPLEQIVDMSVRDRYLVGKLSPWHSIDCDGIEGLEGPTATEGLDEPDEMKPHEGRHEPGAEFSRTSGTVETEAESLEEIDTGRNQSLIPSSFGMTFCVDGKINTIEVETLWGRYERDYDTEIYKTKKNKETGEDERGAKAKVWQRTPCGGTITLLLEEGLIPHQAPDDNQPKVRIQGTVGGKNENGDRLVTLFLVNTQEEPGENKDSAWIFQPELIVRAEESSSDKMIFRQRLKSHSDADDPERDALEMIYRKQVEFAVGHGVAVHAKIAPGKFDHALEVRTIVMPQHELPVTETPGSRLEDRPAMRKMVEKGYLDMESLAEMDRKKLVEVLSILTNDYASWIEEQRTRIGSDVIGHDEQANIALERCKEIHSRLLEGIKVLTNEENKIALDSFRLANLAMAKQRIHSMYALARRRGEEVDLIQFQKRENRSWRSFQLAFFLLSIPSLVDPNHKDRTKAIEAYADLLWFPTGGGKTEAYLGVAAFAMVVRRKQGNLGGYDSSRGLTVIMRYTLRLLTLQQFQRGSTLVCALELLRQGALKSGDESLGEVPFTMGLWVGNKVTPGTTKESHQGIRDHRDPNKFDAGGPSPAQLTCCPWCGTEVSAKRDIEVDTKTLRTKIYCGDKIGSCEFSKGQSSKNIHPGIPVLMVDEEIYHRPPSMMIATVDKFAMMAWKGGIRTLFGRATQECDRHGILWPDDAGCNGTHRQHGDLPRTETKEIIPLRPPDLIIQDEFHLISGPLGTMVGLYESAIDQLSTWDLAGNKVKPKVIASTATVRKAAEQINNVFLRRVAIFPPHGLDVSDNFFSLQRPIEKISGRRYLGVCSPGSSRPAVLIRVYATFLSAAQALFDRFGSIADPYLTTVGYFNSLRELGGMKRLAEDDVRTRCYRVLQSLVKRPGLAQRSANNIRELTSRVSSQDIPKHLDQLEIKFKAEFDEEQEKYITQWEDGETRSIDIVLATNMLSVGVDLKRLGLMVVNGQPKGTAEYIQATSRVGRSFPGLVCTVLTWARPRDLSHYETYEHYHATFYKHVEAQSVTPFSPRAMDRGLTGTFLSILRLENDPFNPNQGARALDRTDKEEVINASHILKDRAGNVTTLNSVKDLTLSGLKERIDYWTSEANRGGRIFCYEKKGPDRDRTTALLKRPGVHTWDNFTIPMSMREVEPGVRLIMNINLLNDGPEWHPPANNRNPVEDES